MIAKVAFASKVTQRSCSRAPAQTLGARAPPHSFSAFKRLRQIAGGGARAPSEEVQTLAVVSMIAEPIRVPVVVEGEICCYFSLMIGWSGCAGFGTSR